MVEPASALVTASAALSVRWVGRKLFGPVCDEIGRGLAESYSERRLRNVTRIGRNAQTKLGAALDEDGAVSPRVARQLLEDGSWCDAEVMAEYFGGILAASRTPDGADDRGLSWARMVSSLATPDINLHFLIYEAYRRLWRGQDITLCERRAVRSQMTMYVSRTDLTRAMGVEDSHNGWGRTVVPSLAALIREGLLDSTWAAGAPAKLEPMLRFEVKEPGLAICPSPSGFELFLWAHGHRLSAWHFLDQSLTLETVEDLRVLDDPQDARELARQYEADLKLISGLPLEQRRFFEWLKICHNT